LERVPTNHPTGITSTSRTTRLMIRDAEFSRPLKTLLTQRYMGKNTLVISSASTMDEPYVQKMAKSKTRKQKKMTRKSLKPYCFSIISSLLMFQYSIETVDSQKN
jgi:hypothetical protein